MESRSSYLEQYKTVINLKQSTIAVAVIFFDYSLVTGNDLLQIENVKQSVACCTVAARFALTEEEKFEYYSGGKLEYTDQNMLVLCQGGCIKKSFWNGCLECNSYTTGCWTASRSFRLSQWLPSRKMQSCRRASTESCWFFDAFMYIYQWMRPDLGYAATFLKRYLYKPEVKHLTQAKNIHILKKLKV